jgi:hypothetical protein
MATCTAIATSTKGHKQHGDLDHGTVLFKSAQHQQAHILGLHTNDLASQRLNNIYF